LNRYLLTDNPLGLLRGGWISRELYEAITSGGPMGRFMAEAAAGDRSYVLTWRESLMRWLGWPWRDPKKCPHLLGRAALDDYMGDIYCLDCGTRLFYASPICEWRVRPSWLPVNYRTAKA
jgi:hypothetical protein